MPLWPLPSFSRMHGGVKKGWFWGQNQVIMAGSGWDKDSSWKLFITSNHINTNRKTWFRAVLAPAILPSCARGGQKWLILRSKSGHNGRVKQGAWNQRGNSLSPRIISILIRKHDLGPLWPLPPFSRVHGGQKWLILGSKSGLNGRVTGINLVTLWRLTLSLY